MLDVILLKSRCCTDYDLKKNRTRNKDCPGPHSELPYIFTQWIQKKFEVKIYLSHIF